MAESDAADRAKLGHFGLKILHARYAGLALQLFERRRDPKARADQQCVDVVANVGGYPGSPYFKITIAGTDRALAATEDRDLVTLPAFTGGPEQLWRIDQLTDGTYRVMPKSVPNSKEPLALSAAGSSTATLDRFSADSDRQRWLLKTP